MIHVDRGQVAVPDILKEPDDGKDRGGRKSGRKEIRKAVKSLKTWLEAGKPVEKWHYDFKIYGHDQVKKALTDLFFGKCAYCESRYAATQPMDVEHWRPKGQVEKANGSVKKPGYYWLAADWDNLLPSCIDCNRKRKQKDAAAKDNKAVMMGKKDVFPIEDETKRAEKEGDEQYETPLLLNPCSENQDPADYLTFVEKGVIAPVSNKAEMRRIAETSVRVYGLNRSDLVLSRREVLRLIELRIAAVRSLSRILKEHPDLPQSISMVIEDLMLREMQELARARKPDQPYSLMARVVIDREMENISQRVEGPIHS